MKSRNALVLAQGGVMMIALLGVAACQGSEKSSAASGQAAAPAATAPAAAPLSGPPHRKPGLWKMTMTSAEAGGALPTSEMCVDDAFEARSSALGQQVSRKACDSQTFTRNLDGSISFSAVCKTGGSATSETHGRITGDFSSHYQVEIESVTQGEAQAKAPHRMTLTGDYEGPCPAGQKGGDMSVTLPNGTKMTLPAGGLGHGPRSTE